MFTPLDLKNKTFTKGFRGYETEEVDKFFAQVVKDFERLYQDNIELKETVERVSAKLEYYQQMEATMQNTLVVAQETADEVKKTSEKKAQVLLDETTAKCEGMKTDAKNEARTACLTKLVLPQHRLRLKLTAMPKKCATKQMPKRISCAMIPKPK